MSSSIHCVNNIVVTIDVACGDLLRECFACRKCVLFFEFTDLNFCLLAPNCLFIFGPRTLSTLIDWLTVSVKYKTKTSCGKASHLVGMILQNLPQG